MKKKIIRIAIIIGIIITCICVGISIVMNNIQNNLNELSNISIENIDISKVSNGIYDGKYKVFPISVKVRVTVFDHRITKIDITEHQNGKGSSAEVITNRVIENQTLNVDTIAGATYSSKVILKSIEDALINTIK
jgi:uncharacterized protein with FMN-binding domain